MTGLTVWCERGRMPGKMARALRIEYAGAVYHVMARGNQGRAIFADDEDRQRVLGTLGEACGKTGWRIHGAGVVAAGADGGAVALGGGDARDGALHAGGPGGGADEVATGPETAVPATAGAKSGEASSVKIRKCNNYRTLLLLL